MRIFFLSERAGGFSVNGAYLGLVDGFERSAEIDPKDGVFCTLSVPGCIPLSFCLDEAFLLDPPPQVTLYRTRRGIAVYMHSFAETDTSLSVLWQERVNGVQLTLVKQGGLQLHFQSMSDFRVISLPPRLQTCKPFPCGENILLEGETAFLLLSQSGDVLVDSEGRVTSKEDGLRAEVPFRDSAGHTAAMEWRGGKLVSCSIRSRREPTEATLALCFFESVLIGADASPFLCDALLPKAGMLREFLGDFCSVVLTEETDLIGLVYRHKPRIFDLRYFRVSLDGGKISNFSEE